LHNKCEGLLTTKKFVIVSEQTRYTAEMTFKDDIDTVSRVLGDTVAFLSLQGHDHRSPLVSGPFLKDIQR